MPPVDKTLDYLLQSVLLGDENGHNFDSYENMVTSLIPSLLMESGRMVTKWPHSGPRATIYTFSVENVVAHPDSIRCVDALEFCLNRTVAYRGTLVLKSRLADSEEDCPHVEIKREEGVLLRVPMMTSSASSKLHAEPEPFMQTGFMLLRGKLRTVPCVQTYIHNYPILARMKQKFMLQVRCQAKDRQYRSTSTCEMYISELENRPSEVGNVTIKLPFQSMHPFNVCILATAFGSDFAEFKGLVQDFAADLFCEEIFEPYFLAMLAHTSYAAKGKVLTQDLAVMYISKEQYGKNSASTGENILRNQTFSHISTGDAEQDVYLKKLYLAQCVATLILYREGERRKEAGDPSLAQRLGAPVRDAFENANMFPVSHSIMYLVRNLYTHHVNQNCKVLRRWLMQQKEGNVDPQKLALVRIFAEQRLTSRVMKAVMSGIFSKTKRGATQALTSTNPACIESQLRKVVKPVSASVGPPQRQNRPGQHGYVCLPSTSDGSMCGLNLEFAMSARLSPACSPDEMAATDQLVLALASPHEPGVLVPVGRLASVGVLVFGVQGFLIGSTPPSDPKGERFVAFVRDLRRTGVTSPFLSVSGSPFRRSLHLSIMEGSPTRPLVVASRTGVLDTLAAEKTPRAQWGFLEEAEAAGAVEYVSAYEAASLALIANNRRQVRSNWQGTPSHLEVSEVAYLSRSAACLPEVTCMQGPRISYAQSMVKQGITGHVKPRIGVVRSSQSQYLFRSLCRTRVSEILGVIGFDQPVVVAIMALSENQEDGVVSCKEFVERGGHHAFEDSTEISENVKYNNTWIAAFEKPGRSVLNCTSKRNYDQLEDNGLPRLGAVIEEHSAVIGKTKKMRSEDVSPGTRKFGGSESSSNFTMLSDNSGPNSKAGENGVRYHVKDISTFNRNDSSTVVVSKRQQLCNTGKKAVVVLRTELPFREGDKVTTRSAQKGVNSAVVPQVDLPFPMNPRCPVPSIFVSPLGQPTRCTTSTFYEGGKSKAVAVSGKFGLGLDAQQLSLGYAEQVREVEKELASKGFNRYGTEKMCDGRTGEVIPARIYVAPLGLLRPNQIAKKKIHARSTGPKDRQTRQAEEGRRKGGGLRVGNMEFNAIVAYGAAYFMLERCCKLSDPFTVYICTKCRMFVDLCNDNIDYFFCHRCCLRETVREVEISFTLYVWLLELRSGGVDMVFTLRDTEILPAPLALQEQTLENVFQRVGNDQPDFCSTPKQESMLDTW